MPLSPLAWMRSSATTRRPLSLISSKKNYAKNWLTRADKLDGEQSMVGLSAPLEGLSRAQTSFDSAAAKIAQPVSPDAPNQQDEVSLSDQMVALMQSRNAYEANLKTLQTGNQMQKTLLDLIG